jgi:hypothetical protein
MGAEEDGGSERPKVNMSATAPKVYMSLGTGLTRCLQKVNNSATGPKVSADSLLEEYNDLSQLRWTNNLE